jgi:hypothetical protein
MLLPCPSCRRHVRAASDRCPFCDAPTRVLAPRAAGLLIASTLVAGGCGPAPAATRETTPTTDNRHAQPGTETAPPEPMPSEHVSEPVPEETPPDERPVPAYGGSRVPRDPQSQGEAPAAAYGGPPMRSPLLPD